MTGRTAEEVRARFGSISGPLPGARHVVGSLGLGVQSTTMALMSKHGLIEPAAQSWFFSDPRRETWQIYEHLRFLQSANLGLPPIHTVSAGDLREDVEASAHSWRALGPTPERKLWRTAARVATPPFYTRGPLIATKTVTLPDLPLFGLASEKVELIVERQTDRETFGMLRRQCTSEYKIEPVTKAIRGLLGLAPGERGPAEPVVELWIGLTTDELERLTTSHVRYIHQRHPLIEHGMSRGDCIQWLLRHGYPVPPKSRCYFCPFQSDILWTELKQDNPEEFEDACSFDELIRDGLRGIQTTLYLHPSRRPLREVDFTNPAGLWTNDGLRNECLGACGL